MVKSALFDDTDPSITYNGSWNQLGVLGTYAPEYNGTVHQTTDSTATVDIAFKGIGISVYGSIQYTQATGVPNSNYVLDQNGPIRFNASGSMHFPSNNDQIYTHLLLYQSGPIADGSHTLKINLDGLSGNGPSYYLDYYTVEVADDAEVDTVIADDRDPSVLYGGPWIDQGGFYESDGTTRKPSQGATIDFPFNGTELTVYGTLDSAYANQPILSFQIDSDASVNLTLPSTSGVQYHQPFFHAAGLSRNQIHTLTVKTLATNAIFIDYFTYKTGDGSDSDGSNNGNNNSIGDGGDKSKANVGAIAGGVVGGVVVLALIIFSIFLLMKKRNAKQKEQAVEEAKYTQATPYSTYPQTLPSSYSNSNFNGNANTTTNMHPSPNVTSTHSNLTMAGLINNTFSPPPYSGHSPPPPASTVQSGSTYDSAEPLQATRYPHDTKSRR